MSAGSGAVLHVVYGIVEDPGAALARLRAADPGTSPLTPMSFSMIHGSPALRLNSHGWMNLPADVVSGLSGTEALLHYCRERLHNRVSVFSLAIRAFLSHYLDVVEAEIEHLRGELESRISKAGLPISLGFPTHRDFAFSALLPLPNAYIGLSGDRSGGAEFVRVDALFWDGKTATAVLLEGNSAPTRSDAQRLKRLEDESPHVSILRLKKPMSGIADIARRSLNDAVLPFGPYRTLHRDAFAGRETENAPSSGSGAEKA
ncbi:hypothetical protein [Terrihabitans rhizophilus]|uniref:DUF1828 domain-containing protein n=1 Tax=Terrihabitans rhizophilus TaxID=3092662 RepID=A0ABU4RL28_9HYPH|nr:hypothetical protein [Terrihabitans sp. PJ23]MDX6805544.1 hypothetical protein [Terrihabitans sp. PJ23]